MAAGSGPLYLDLVFHRFVKFLDAFEAKISIPNAAGSRAIKIGLLIPRSPLKHDFHAVTADNRKNMPW